jgi:hypothetical protein
MADSDNNGPWEVRGEPYLLEIHSDEIDIDPLLVLPESAPNENDPDNP